TRVIVSTDDDEIAEVAKQFGADVPFLRPNDLAQDDTQDLPVFQHALQWLDENEGYFPELVVQLRPTSPVRPHDCVDDAIRLLLDNPEAESVRGVVSAGQNPYKMWKIDPKDGKLNQLLTVEGIPEPYNAPRQILPQVYWQTGHIDVIRPETILEKNSMSGDVILPLILESQFTVDIDNLNDWKRSEWLVKQGSLGMVHPGPCRRSLPESIELIVFDFDGVMTDNRVWVNEEGGEMVAAYRSDSIGINLIRQVGIKVFVLSTEVNPVVAVRCKKLNLPVVQGIDDKATILKKYLQDHAINPQNVVYLGNDINDVPCFPVVGCAVVVADAQPEAIRKADIVLSRRGGQGAVRELCDMVFT
ncbi:MAG: acylneuraminate cytidylyltransferase, partial [Anaerolineaceae bacterium]|nr:acylneuraminate cytidylyltransferase [Anaerolineaceae bacterium]